MGLPVKKGICKSAFPNTNIMMKNHHLESDKNLQTDEIQVFYRQFDFSEHASLILTTGYSSAPHILSHIIPQHSETTVGYNFCLQGKSSFLNKGKYSPAGGDESSVNHILFPRAETNCQLEVNGQFAQILFCVNKDYYFNLLNEYAEFQPKGFLRAAEMPGYCFFNKNPWTPAFRQVNQQILQNQMEGLSGKLFFESKMLELTALFLETYRKQPMESAQATRLDRDKMHFVRELLEQNLVNPPTLGRLARLAGTNEFALKKHFKAIFGVPVFKYLQQLRLDKAYSLLNETDMQVGEAAQEVGYESISAFSRAFKVRFGIQPQMLR